jgi:hypothetical protein
MKRLLLVIIALSCVPQIFADGASYLIIAPDSFVSAVQPLADWKTKKGVLAKVVPLSVTGNTAAQIKNYILNAYNNWEIRPAYILLIGTGNLIPSWSIGYGGRSDDNYADISGNYRIELRIGRFPCATCDQCRNIVVKTIDYERAPFLDDTTWYRKGTTIVDEGGQDADSVYWNDVRYIHSLWQNDHYIHIDSFSFYQHHDSLAEVMYAINDGRAFIAFRGVATVNWWDFPIEPESLNNGYKQPVVISGTCATMSLFETGYLGDKFLTAGDTLNPKGAVGFFGTTVATDLPGLARLRGTVTTGFFRSVFQDNVLKLGDATRRAKFILDSIQPPNYIDARYKEWNLFGDPELALYTCIPKPLTVMHDTIIQTGPQNYNVTVNQAGNPAPNALVCVMMDSTIYQYGYTNSAGTVSFVIYSPYPGTMSVTVTAQNCMPYEKNVHIIPGGNVHDVAALSIVAPQGSIAADSAVVPKVLVKNLGSYTDTFSITFKISNVYSCSIPSVILRPGDTVTATFPTWNSTIGNYVVTAYISLVTDQWHANDTTRTLINVITPNDVGVDTILNPLAIHSLNRATLPKAIIKNYGALQQTNFPVVCSIFGTNRILRYASTKTTSLFAGRDTTVSFASWTPTVIETCTVKINTQLVNDENPLNDCKIRMTTISEYYIENFEENNGGYRANPISGGWRWGVPNCGPNASHSGIKCWNSNSGQNANWKLTSIEFTASTNNPVLKFWHWYDMYEHHDGGNIKISTDSGASWTLLHPENGYPGWVNFYNQGIPNESCYTGMSDWTEASFTLPVLSGQRFYVMWHFGTDWVNRESGWYIDDITGIGMSGRVNDVGVDSILCPSIIQSLNTYLQPTAAVSNLGILDQENFPAVCSIINTNGVLRYTDTKYIALAAGRDTIVNFASWFPTTTEICTVKISTKLIGDENPVNDRKTSISEIRWLLFEEGFEEPYFPPTGWAIYNNDSGTQCWVRETSSPHTGSAYAECQFENSTLRNDDWLVTQAISIPTTNAELDCWYRAYSYNIYETLQVRLSITGNEIDDFTVPLGDFRFNNLTYAENIIPLTGYAGQNIYIAFINKGLYRRKIYLDDILVKSFTMGVAEHTTNNQPLVTMLYLVKPNPATRGLSQISFSLSEPQKVAIRIFDISGRLIKTLVNEQKNTGNYSLIWNGTDDNNREVSEGVYFCILKTDEKSLKQKILLVK